MDFFHTTRSRPASLLLMFKFASVHAARGCSYLGISRPVQHLSKPPTPMAVCRMSTSSLKPAGPPVSYMLPGDSFQLLDEGSKNGSPEDELFDEQVQQVRAWWASPRFKGIRRPYSAEDVVSKRGSLQQTYPSSLMARKLFNLLQARAAQGKPVHTSA